MRAADICERLAPGVLMFGLGYLVLSRVGLHAGTIAFACMGVGAVTLVVVHEKRNRKAKR